jgi:hypothetical protein
MKITIETNDGELRLRSDHIDDEGAVFLWQENPYTRKVDFIASIRQHCIPYENNELAWIFDSIKKDVDFISGNLFNGLTKE